MEPVVPDAAGDVVPNDDNGALPKTALPPKAASDEVKSN